MSYERSAKELSPIEQALRTCCRWTWPDTATYCGYCGKELPKLDSDRRFAIGRLGQKGYYDGPFKSLGEALDMPGERGDIIFIVPDDIPLFRWRKYEWVRLNVVSDNLISD